MDAFTSRPPRRPTLLVILDGVGLNPGKENNALALAHTPNLDRYLGHNPHTVIEASGRAVGLPTGQMGNSEVGHTTIGAGAIIRQDLVRIDDAIADGSFFENPVLCAAAQKAARAGRPVHLVGLVSDGGVHSHIDHLIALMRLCHKEGARPVVHMITDGRDTPPRSALSYLERLEGVLAETGGAIYTVSGRYYAMDRDRRWERTEAAWRAIALAEGRRRARDAREAICQAYAAGETDEFITPTVIQGAEAMSPEDQVIFFNFRNDRSRQLTYALAGKDFDCFDRDGYRPVPVTCLTEYDARFDLPVAFPPQAPEVTLAQVVSEAGIRQFHCAETEKYAHVTFFLNGGREDPYPGEERKMIPSPKVATYDQQPEMSAPEVARTVVEAMESGRYGFIVVNFANGDMVGHTAVREAVIRAVEAVDTAVGEVLDAAMEHGYSVVLTADHGNCDEMVDPITGEPHTQHTTYPVPCLIIDEVPWRLATGGGLSNIAATVLQLMGLERPVAMTGDSLLLQALPKPGERQEGTDLAACSGMG